MADYTDTPQRGHAPHWHPENAASHGNSVTRLTNLTGALVSLALVVGVAVWGYKLFVRDVSGIPVVRAVAGDMRVRPEEPGGQLARHQGLSVNTVTALGASEKRAEELRLAPRPVDLADEDQPMPQITQAVSAADRAPEAVQKPGAPGAQDIAAALESGNVDNLVAQMTNGIAPMENLTGESAPCARVRRDANRGRGVDGRGDARLATPQPAASGPCSLARRYTCCGKCRT